MGVAKHLNIEIDVDGVLNNIYGHVDTYVNNNENYKYLNFSCKKHLRTWSMKEFDMLEKGLRNYVFDLFDNKEFMSSIPVDATTLADLTRLRVGLFGRCQLFVNTGACGKTSEEIRKDWLDRTLLSPCLIDDYEVTIGTKNMFHHMDVTFEDNIENLNRSSAWLKILVKQPHNAFFTSDDIVKTYPSGLNLVVDSFSEGVDAILKIRDLFYHFQE